MIILLVCLLAGLSLPIQVQAQPLIRVSIDPSFTRVDPNEIFDLSVMISAEADTFSNFQVFVEFDPTVLEFVEAFEGSLYANSPWPNPWFLFEEESPGLWQIFEIIFPAMSYIVAPGELTRIRFRALAGGVSPVHFVSVAIKDILRFPLLPVLPEDGLVHVNPVIGIEPDSVPLTGWQLGPAVPNPTPGPTRIFLSTPIVLSAGQGEVGIYDARGRLVQQLTHGLAGGAHDLLWDGRDTAGEAVPSGVYFFRLVAPDETLSRRVVLIR